MFDLRGLIAKRASEFVATAEPKESPAHSVWYHTGTNPGTRTDTDYVHLGAHPAVGEQRRGGERRTYEVQIAPKKPLNHPDRPLDDWTANRIGMYASTHAGLGRAPRSEDFDPDFEDAPDVAKESGWTPEHDAIYYLNDTEKVDGKPTISAMVRPSAIHSVREIPRGQPGRQAAITELPTTQVPAAPPVVKHPTQVPALKQHLQAMHGAEMFSGSNMNQIIDWHNKLHASPHLHFAQGIGQGAGWEEHTHKGNPIQRLTGLEVEAVQHASDMGDWELARHIWEDHHLGEIPDAVPGRPQDRAENYLFHQDDHDNYGGHGHLDHTHDDASNPLGTPPPIPGRN